MNRMLALAALAVALLAGCSSPAAAPTPTAPTPTATAAEIDDSPATVTITAQAVSVQSATDEVLDSFTYTEAPDVAIAMLTELFDAEPTIDEVPGLEQPGYTAYNWTGFELQVLAEGSEPYPPLRVKVTVTSVADLLITTTDGLAVGVDADTVAGRYPDSTLAFTPPGLPPRFAITLGEIDGLSVGLEGETGGPITSITAPQLG